MKYSKIAGLAAALLMSSALLADECSTLTTDMLDKAAVQMEAAEQCEAAVLVKSPTFKRVCGHWFDLVKIKIDAYAKAAKVCSDEELANNMDEYYRTVYLKTGRLDDYIKQVNSNRFLIKILVADE